MPKIDDIIDEMIAFDKVNPLNDENSDWVNSDKWTEWNDSEDKNKDKKVEWEDNWELNDWEYDESIENIIKQYWWDIKKLAKSKRSSDSEISKIIAEKKVIEQIYNDRLYNKEKKLVEKDRTYLLDIIDEDVKLAEKLSQDIFWINLSDYIKEIEEEYLNSDVDETLNELLWKKVWKDDIEKLVQLRVKEERLKILKEQEEKDLKWKVSVEISNFIKDNWIDDEKSFNDIYKELLGERDVTPELNKKILKSALVIFNEENWDKNDKQKQIKITEKNRSFSFGKQEIFDFGKQAFRLKKQWNGATQ